MFLEILSSNEELVNEMKSEMMIIENRDREMENLDFIATKNISSKDFFDYMIQHKVLITKNNYENALLCLLRFEKYAIQAKVNKKDVGVLFYLH
jgi:hypothetical protein